jgi:hypothetical protein
MSVGNMVKKAPRSDPTFSSKFGVNPPQGKTWNWRSGRGQPGAASRTKAPVCTGG